MPKGIWEIDGRDVCRLKPDPSGGFFRDFVDALLQAQTHAKGVVVANLHCNIRTNKPDGGVDTQIDVELDTGNPWFDRPTAWQFKSCEARTLSTADLKSEIKKDYAADLVLKGYGYRLCICDDLSSEQQVEWESELLAAARDIAKAPSKPYVLTASNLATWANNFPSVIVSRFEALLATLARDFGTWGQTITDVTRTYVSLPGWDQLRARLAAHFDFPTPAGSVVFPLKGEAGVGKSRFAYEVLLGMEGARFLVLYADDKHRDLATYLATANAAAILVADECSPETEDELEQALRGHRDRVRVLVIRNDARPPFSGAPEFRLKPMSEVECESVLTANFPEIPRDARRDYARLCKGFVRLAADMCENHANIAQAGHPGPILDQVRNYFERRIPDERDRMAVEALALSPKVGYADDVAEQLPLLCGLLGLDSQFVIEVARRLHDRPGFVAKTTRFLYVTPQIVAQVAFSAAWRRWIQDDPPRFFRTLPESLLAEFQERVRTTALPEERRAFAEFFFSWAASLTPSDLGETEQIRRLITFTEVEPDVYLDCLHRLIDQASDEEIRAICNEERGWVRTGSRRNLVWLLERLVWFPEYFDRSEEILLRLATNEMETDIANNATAIWIGLYSPALPGTAVPFGERLAKLRQRTLASDQRISDLAFTALGEILGAASVHRVDIPALGGRVRPREANPRTAQEWVEYERVALSLVADLSRNLDPTLRRKAEATVSKNLRILLATGHLAQLQEVLKPGEIEEENLAQTLNGIDEFLHFEGAATSSAGSAYINQVSAWRRALQPLDIHARLVSSVGIEPWRPSMTGEDEWRAELRALAEVLAGDGKALTDEIPWLCSESAKGAAYLGEELAKADSEGRLLETVIEAALRYGEGALARGYVIGAVRNPRLDIGKLNSLLDRVEASNPSLAFDIFWVGGSSTRAVERTIALVDDAKLPLTYFRTFTIGDFLPDGSQLQVVLELLVSAAEKSDVQATEIALDVFGYRIVHNSHWRALLEKDNVQELAWRLAAAAAAGNAGRESFWWAELVKKLGQFDARRAARIASTGLVSAGFSQSHSASDVLTELASEHAMEVMNELGSLILDDAKGGWRVLIGKYPIFTQLPWEVIAKWIRDHGVEAAKRLAGQLPPPYVSKDGSPIVPPLTAFVLSEFVNSDEVFRAFVAGVHNLQGYSGNIADQHEREAEVAKKFLGHQVPRIREWAALELQQAQAEARHWRQMEEEMHIP